MGNKPKLQHTNTQREINKKLIKAQTQRTQVCDHFSKVHEKKTKEKHTKKKIIKQITMDLFTMKGTNASSDVTVNGEGQDMVKIASLTMPTPYHTEA